MSAFKSPPPTCPNFGTKKSVGLDFVCQHFPPSRDHPLPSQDPHLNHQFSKQKVIIRRIQTQLWLCLFRIRTWASIIMHLIFNHAEPLSEAQNAVLSRVQPATVWFVLNREQKAVGLAHEVKRRRERKRKLEWLKRLFLMHFCLSFQLKSKSGRFSIPGKTSMWT